MNDIDSSLIDKMGGEDRLKEVLYYMWNDIATGGTQNLDYLLDEFIAKIFSPSDMIEYLSRTE